MTTQLYDDREFYSVIVKWELNSLLRPVGSDMAKIVGE